MGQTLSQRAILHQGREQRVSEYDVVCSGTGRTDRTCFVVETDKVGVAATLIEEGSYPVKQWRERCVAEHSHVEWVDQYECDC